MSTTPQPPNGSVTLREVYALLNTTRAEFVAEIQKLETAVQKRWDSHQQTHHEEELRRVGLWRWAVTSIIAFVGVSAAIVIPLLQR